MAARTPFRCCSESESALSPKLCAFPGWLQTMPYSRAGPWSKRAQSGCVVQARNWPESWAVLNFFLCLVSWISMCVHAFCEWRVGFLQPSCYFHWFSNQLRGLVFPASDPWAEMPNTRLELLPPPRGHLITASPFLCESVWILLTALVVQESFCQSPFCFQWEFLHRWMCFLGLHETK